MNLAKLFESLAQLDTSETLDCATRILMEYGYTIETDTIDPDASYAVCSPPEPSPVGLVAHCDTVGACPPKRIQHRGGILTVKGGGILGADDRAGVAGIIAAVIQGHRPQVYLTTGEETGGLGAERLAESYSPPDTLHVLIQLDRQSGTDFVTYGCESKRLNKWVTRHGFLRSTGSFSDISVLAPAWGIAAANVSVGYYGQHTEMERLVVPQLAHTVARVGAMIQNPPAKRIEYVERQPVFSRSWSYGKTRESGTSSIWNDDRKDTLAECRVSCKSCGQMCRWIELDAYDRCLDCSVASKIR